MAYAGLGYALVMARKYDEAIAQAERGLELEPNSADVVYIYAIILLFIGRREEAIPFFKSAIRLNPKPPNTYLRHLAAALRDTGRYEEAIAQVKKAIEREPRDIIVIYRPDLLRIAWQDGKKRPVRQRLRSSR